MVVDNDLLEPLLRFLLLPCLIGFILAVVTFYYDYLVTRRSKERENRLEQLQLARETYLNIISDMEDLFSLMKYSAWNVAWRKARPAGIFSADLIDEDETKWRIFDDALREWRRKKIRYRADLETYFGKKETSGRQFRIIDAVMEKLSYEIWLIYHGVPNNPNVFMEHYVQPIEEAYDSIFNCIMKANQQTISKEQEENVHQITSSAFDDLEEKIIKLCSEMAESLKKENVGNLRKPKLQRQIRS
jgi:hypothetical protein